MMVDARKALQNGKAARKHFPKHVTQPITNVQAVRRSYRDAGIPEDEVARQPRPNSPVVVSRSPPCKRPLMPPST